MANLTLAGLTENESKLYIALLELGPSLAGIIARKSGLHRRTVYDTTEMLINKGLVGYILQNNRRLFQASNPQRLLEILEEKQQHLTPAVEELQKKYRQTSEKQETLFFKGREGLKQVFEDQLNEKEILILGARENASEILNFYVKWYNKKRKKRKIVTKVIAHSRKAFKMWDADIRYLPEKYASPLAINIYGNKTAIILWSKNPLAIVINQKEITKGYKNYFDLLWKIAKK